MLTGVISIHVGVNNKRITKRKGDNKNMPTVLLMASLDTRGKEAVYLRTLIEGLGCKVILTDISMRKHDQAGADYTCADVAREGEASFEQISSHKGTSEIITPMIKGCVKIARKLLEAGSIDAIAGFGGASNTLFVSSVMGSLPFGLPSHTLQFCCHSRIRCTVFCVQRYRHFPRVRRHQRAQRVRQGPDAPLCRDDRGCLWDD